MAVCRPIRRPTIRPTRYRSFLLRKLGSAVSRCFRLLLARAAREATSRDRTLSRCVHITSLVVRGSSASPGTSTNLLTGRVRSRVRSVSHVRKTFDFKRSKRNEDTKKRRNPRGAIDLLRVSNFFLSIRSRLFALIANNSERRRDEMRGR